VIACGAIGSSVLLMKSGLGGRNVGKRFSFNAGAPIYGLFPERMDSWDGVQMASYVDCGNYILESLFNPPASLAMALPGWFETHYERMHAYSRLACFGVLIGTDHNARVKGWSWTRSTFGPVKYKMRPHDLRHLKDGLAQAARVLLAAGADEVYTTAFADTVIRRPADAAAVIEDAIRSPRDLVFGSSHPQGGNAMSDDPGIGVVDSDLRVHGVENLYVCDASVFPTTIRVNPQLTIMALADSFSRRVLLRSWSGRSRTP
jgi:choline dehydrogenase-like flavoprotein